MNLPVKPGQSMVTVTLKPSMFEKRARRQHKQCWGHINRLVQMFSKTYYIVTELTKKANVHYHISVEWTDQYSQLDFLDTIKTSTLFGNTFINEKTITDVERTYQYFEKAKPQTDRIINKGSKCEKLNISFHYTGEIHKSLVEKKTRELDALYNLDNNIADDEFEIIVNNIKK